MEQTPVRGGEHLDTHVPRETQDKVKQVLGKFRQKGRSGVTSVAAFYHHRMRHFQHVSALVWLLPLCPVFSTVTVTSAKSPV